MANEKAIDKSKSEKYNQAVAKATGTAGADQDDMKGGAMIVGDVSELFTNWTPEDVTEKARSGKYEFAPQMGQIKRGQQLTCFLEGEGPGNDFTNEKTGEVRHVKSWIFVERRSGMRISILSSAQLDRKLPPFVGTVVTVARAKEDIELKGGFRCADFMVFGEKLESGPRSFSTPPSMSQPALPPGATIIDADAEIASQPNGIAS
jgi:hypothetical protein